MSNSSDTTAATPPDSTQTTTTPTSSTNLPAVVGGVVGGIACFVVIIIIITLLVCKITKRRNRRPPPPLPHPDEIGPVYVPDPAPDADGVDPEYVYVDPGEDADKSKANISVDSDDLDLPEPNNNFLNNNKPNNSTQSYTPHKTTLHNNSAHNNTTPHKTSLHPPRIALVPKSSSESVINRNGDHVVSTSRPRAGSLKQTEDEDYIQMGGSGKSPILCRTLPPPSTCKPKAGHGYINLPNEDECKIPKSLEPDPTRNSDVYENFATPTILVESTSGEIDNDQCSEKEKIPKYINVEKIVPHLNTHADGNLSEEEQESYINMENLSVSPPPSGSVSDKLNELLGATGHSLGRPSRPNTPSKETSPNATDLAYYQGVTPKANEVTSNKGRFNAAPKPKLDQSKGKSLNHSRENEEGVEVSVLFKNVKSIPDLPLVVSNADIPDSKAKNLPGVKLNISRAANVPNERHEKPMESDSNTETQNSDNDCFYENSAEFYRSQDIENISDSSGPKGIDEHKADHLGTPAPNKRTESHEKQMELDSNTDDQISDHDGWYENSAEFYRSEVIEDISESSGQRPIDKNSAGRIGTPGTNVSENTNAEHTKTPSPTTKNARKPPAVLPKSVAKNNKGTPDIAELKSRLKKTNFVHNVSGENQKTN